MSPTPPKLTLTLLAGVSLLLAACVNRPPDRVEELLGQALRSAESHHEFDNEAEAVVLADAVYAVDPRFPGLLDLRDELDPDARSTMKRSWLGMNRKHRPEVQRPVWAQVALWLPDRVLDLMDVVSFDVHFGFGAYADVHVTRAMQLAGGMRTTGGIGLHDHRSLGLKSQAEAGLTAIAAGAHSYGGGLVGTSGALAASSSTAGLHRPSDPLYQSFRDYWAVGASATAGIVGAELEFHPAQLVDFFGGWVGFDLLRDDFRHTRSLRLDIVDRQLVTELWRVGDSSQALAAYHSAKQRGELAYAPAPPPEPDQAAAVEDEVLTEDELPTQEEFPAAPAPE
jgi:hypothetical protein